VTQALHAEAFALGQVEFLQARCSDLTLAQRLKELVAHPATITHARTHARTHTSPQVVVGTRAWQSSAEKR
jgi:hypothetical protein